MPKVEVVTNRYDNLRSGVNSQESALTPDTVGALKRLFTRTVDGDIYTQPTVRRSLPRRSAGCRSNARSR